MSDRETPSDRGSPLGASLGGYDILAERASGGMGEVLIGRKRAVGGFERLVALKTVRAELAEVGAAREMFLDEGRLLAQLHHRGIAQVYDFGEDTGRLYLAMEYVAGIDFDALAAREPSPRIACLAMAEAARALHAAHELTDKAGQPLGVVHRDVSPGNLMLTFDGSIKVLDFGIALMRNRRAPVTEFGMLKGKPPYMAPEQVRSEAIDRRTDVFSASAVLWELLTGERLFTGDSIFAIGRLIEQGEVEPPSSRRPDLSPELDAAVLQGLAKDPADRFESASALASCLESVARKLGSETLADYSRAELGAEKAAHEAYVASLVRTAERRQRRVGRGTSVNTIPAIEGAELAIADTASAAPRPEGPAAPDRSRWPLVLMAFALAAGLGFFAWQLIDGPREGGAVAELAIDAAADGALDGGGGSSRLDAIGESAIDAAPQDAPAEITDRTSGGRRKPNRDADPGRTERVTPKVVVDAAPLVSAPVGKGTLTMLHVPGDSWAIVRIDGRAIGNSPRFDVEVSAGPHTITWVEPDTGAVRTKKSVVVVAGQHQTLRATARAR